MDFLGARSYSTIGTRLCVYESIFEAAKNVLAISKSKQNGQLLESLHLLVLDESVPVPGVANSLLPVGPIEHGVVAQWSICSSDIMFFHEQCRDTLLQASLIAATAKFELSKPSVNVVVIVVFLIFCVYINCNVFVFSRLVFEFFHVQ